MITKLHAKGIERILLEDVDVVVGIILNGNKFLVERRRSDTSKPCAGKTKNN